MAVIMLMVKTDLQRVSRNEKWIALKLPNWCNSIIRVDISLIIIIIIIIKCSDLST